MNIQNLNKWVSANKQIGEVFSFEKEGVLYWSSVAIQKWGSIIKVYVDEILETEMDAENYEREEILEFPNLETALEFVSSNTMSAPERLKPCKGQKIFNPTFN